MNAIVAGNGLGLFNGGVQDLGLTGGSLGQAGSRYYVNGVTGNLMIQRQDQVLVGHGQDTALVRTYNSQGQLDADNWYFRFEQKLVLGIDSETSLPIATRTTADGFEQVFTYDPSTNTYNASTDGAGAHDTLQQVDSGTWLYTEGSSQNREYYESNSGSYRLVRVEDAQGYVSRYRYDANGRIDQIIDASDQVTEFEYSGTSITVRTYNGQFDGSGNVVGELGVDSKLLRYDYDAEGRLSRVTVDLTPYNEESDDNIFVTEYQYVSGTKLISEIREWQGNTPSTQATIKFRYHDWTNSADARIRQVIVGQDNKALVTDYRYRMESGQSIVEARQFLQYQVSGDTYNPLRTATTTYTFDSDGRLVFVKTPSNQSGGIRYTSQYSYNDNGDLVFVKDNDNRVSRYTYTDSGNLETQLDGEGNYVKYDYENNLLTAEHRYTNIDVDINDGLLPSDSSATPETTRYFYDGQNRLRFVVNAKGQVVETRYAQYNDDPDETVFFSNVGTADTDTDAENDFKADKTGRTTRTYQYLNALTPSSLVGIETLAAFKALVVGAESGLSEAQAKITETQYDFRGQVASIIQYDGGNSVRQHFVYDGQGRLIKSIDGRGARHETNDAGSPALNTRGRYQTLYVYDGLGRLVASAVASVGDEPVNTLTTSALTDALQASAVSQNTLETQFHSFSTYTFEGGQYLVTTRNEAGLQQVQTYSSAGLLIQQTQTDLTQTQTTSNVDNTYYHYDSAGRLRMTIDPEAIRTHNLYNDRGQLVATVDGSGALTEYEYNGSGQLVRTIAYAKYLGISQLIKLAVEDASATNRGKFKPLQVAVADIRPNFSADDRVTHNLYDAAGRLAYSIDGEGYVTEYQYDGKSQLTNTIRHSTPYEGYGYVSEDGIAVRNIDNAAIEAFARYEYDAGRYTVDPTTWEQLPREVTGALQATHSVTRELVEDPAVNASLNYVPHGYGVINGTYENPSHTFTVQSLGTIVGQATWNSSFNRSSVNGEPVNHLNPEHYGFVAFSGNQFGRIDTGGVDVVDQPYFKVVDGVAELTPYNVLYEGDVNWLGQGNSRDRTTFSGTRQYDRDSEDGVTFEFEISQDLIVDNGQLLLLGFGDEKGNQYGLRLSEQYSYLDDRSEDAFYQMTSFTRLPGEIYKIAVTIQDSIASFKYYRKNVSVDENGVETITYSQINSSWPTTYTLGDAWGDAFHSVVELAGKVSAADVDADSQDPSTSTTVTKLYNVKEQGALLSAPFRNVIDGTGYDALVIDHNFGMAQTSPVPHNWGFSAEEGSQIGESPQFSIAQVSHPVANGQTVTEANLKVKSLNDPALATNDVSTLLGETEFLRNPSLPVSFKYYFSGDVDTASSRFFLGVRDEAGNQFGELLTYNDIIAATGVSGTTYAQIETARSTSDTSYLEFELVSGKFQVYYLKNVLFDENGEELLVDGVKYSQVHKVLVDEFSIGDWGAKVRSVIQVRDLSGSTVKQLNVRSLVESGVKTWDKDLYSEGTSTTPGITLENIIPLKNSEQDAGVYLEDISAVEASLYRANSDGSRGELVQQTATLINPDTYNGEVEIFKGNLEDLDDGRYLVELDVSLKSGGEAEGINPVYYVHNGYSVLDRHVTGAALDNFFTSDGTGSPLGLSIDQIVSQYQSLRVRIKGQDTGYFDTIDTNLGAPELYTGYLLLSDQQALADDIYDIIIEGIPQGGGEIATLGQTRLQVGERYQYDHSLNFTLGGDGQPIVPDSDIVVRYWRTGAGSGSGEEQTFTMALPAANANGIYDIQVDLQNLLKGAYEFTVEYLQQDTNGQPRADYSTVSGSFAVGVQQSGSVNQSLDHNYLDADVKESPAGLSVIDYLELTNASGVEFALENLPTSVSKEHITHLTATVIDVSNNSVVSTVVTDRTSLPVGAENALMLVKDNALLKGSYRVEVTATIDDGVAPVHQRAINGFELTIDNNPLVEGSQNNQTTRMVWDGEPGKNVKLTFGDAGSDDYVEIDITNPPNGGAPTATVTNKIHPDNVLGNTLVKGITPGLDFGANTLALGSIHTQVGSYTSTGQHVNAGLTHTINSVYRNEPVQVASEIDAGYLNLVWDAKTHVQDFSDGAGEFNLNPDNLTDENQIHAILDDGQLLLRNTGSSAEYTVDSEWQYTNVSPALFSIEFNVGRAAYNGFIGISHGTDRVGLNINENRQLTLNGVMLLDGAEANTSYRLDMEIQDGQAIMRLFKADDTQVGADQIINAASWTSYNLQLGISGNKSRIGNPLIINRVSSTGMRAGQQTQVELKREGESVWSAIAAQNVSLQNENGRLVYRAQVNTAGLEDQELAVRITDATSSGAVIRQGEFSTLVAQDTEASHTTSFNTLQDKSVQATGTAIANFFARNEAFDYAVTNIYDADNNLIDTVTTWRNAEGYARELILNHSDKLDNGTYRLEVQKYGGDVSAGEPAIIRHYTISDDQGTATQSVSWTLPEGSMLNPSNVVFNYRISGSTQAYQKNPISYDAQTGMFTSTLTLGQGVEVDFLISEVNESNTLLKSFNGKFIMGQSSGTYIEGALALKDVLVQSDVQVAVNGSATPYSQPLSSRSHFNGDLLIRPSAIPLADGGHTIAYEYGNSITEDAIEETHIIGGIAGMSAAPVVAVEKFDTYLFNLQIDITSKTGAVSTKEVVIELAKDLSTSNIDIQQLNSGRYAFGIEYQTSYGSTVTKSTEVISEAHSNVTFDEVRRYFASSIKANMSAKLAIETTQTDTNLSALSFGYEYVRTSEVGNIQFEMDVIDDRFSNNISLSQNGERQQLNIELDNTHISSGLYNSATGSTVTQTQRTISSGRAFDYRSTGLRKLYILSKEELAPEALSGLNWGYSTGYTEQHWGNNPLLDVEDQNFFVAGWDYNLAQRVYPVYNGDEFWLAEGLYKGLPLSWMRSASDIDGDISSFGSSSVNADGILDIGKILSLNQEYEGVHYSYRFEDENTTESESEGQFKLYSIDVSVSAELLNLQYNTGSFLHGWWTPSVTGSFNFSIGEQTLLSEIDEINLSNNVTLSLPSNLINNKYRVLVDYYDGDTSNPDFDPENDYKRAIENNDGSVFVLDNYNTRSVDDDGNAIPLNLRFRLYDIADVGLDTPIGQEVTPAHNFVKTAEIVNNEIQVDFEDEISDTGLEKNHSGLGVQLKIAEDKIRDDENGAVKAVSVEFLDYSMSTTSPVFGSGRNVIDSTSGTFDLGDPFVTNVSEISVLLSGQWDRKINLLTGGMHAELMAAHPEYFVLDESDPNYGRIKGGNFGVRFHVLYENGQIATETMDLGPIGEIKVTKTPELDLVLDVSTESRIQLGYFDGAVWQSQASNSNGKHHQFHLQELEKPLSETEVLVEPQEFDYQVFVFDEATGKEKIATQVRPLSVDYNSGETSQVEIEFVRHANGREIRNFYDINGQLQAILHPDGAFEEYIYDGTNQLISTIRYGIRVEDEQARANGSFARIKEIVAPVGQSSDVNRYNFTFYDFAGRVLAEVDSDRYVTHYDYVNHTALLSQSTRHAYRLTDDAWADLVDDPAVSIGVNWTTISSWLEKDDQNNVDTSRDQNTSFSYNDQGAILAQTDLARDVKTEWQYDAMGRTREIITGIDVLGDTEDLTEARSHEIEYDAKGRIKQEWIGSQSWSYEYNQNGQRTSATLHSDEEDQPNRTTRYFYDADGRLVFTLDDLNQLNEIRYNAFGGVISKVAYASFVTQQNLGVNPSGLTGGVLSANLLAKFRNIDRVGVNTQRDDHSETLNLYNRRGELRISVDAEGNRMDYQYNAFGEVWREIRHARGGNLDGRQIVNQFIYDKAGRAVTTVKDVLGRQQSTGTRYDAFGRVISTTDGNNQVTYYDYGFDPEGRVIEVRHQSPQGLVLSRTLYDAFDRVVTVTDANGQSTTYNYDDAARSLTVTTAEGIAVTTVTNVHGESITVDNGEGYVDHFQYDANGSLTTTSRIGQNTLGEEVISSQQNTYYSSGLLKETTDANDNRVVYYYDAAQRLIRRVTDPDGLALTTEYLYDARANGKQVTERVVLDAASNNQIDTIREFDRNGRLSHLWVRGATEEEDIHTYFQYDDQGREVLVSTGAMHQPTWALDDETNEVRRVFLDGLNAVRYEYDALGRRTAEIRDPSYTDQVSGERLYQGLDITTRYTYDASNNLIRSTAPNGARTWFYYDDRNRQVFSVNHLGEVTRSIYDDASNLVETVEYAAAISTFALTGGTELNAIEQRLAPVTNRDRHAKYLYDGNNRLIFSRDALGHISETFYKANTNQVIETRRYAKSADVVWDTIDNVRTALLSGDYQSQKIYYDALGRVEFSVDAVGAVTQNRYDNGGRIVATVRYATLADNGDIANYRDGSVDDVKLDPANQYTWYGYDNANRQTVQVDAEGYVTETRYDEAGRVTQLREYNQSLFAGLSETQIDNLESGDTSLELLLEPFKQSQDVLQNNHISQQVSRLGNIEQGLPESEWTVVTQAPVYRDTLTTYDKAGRVSSITDAIGALKLAIADAAFSRGIATKGAHGHTESYTYDAMGNRTSLTNKKGDTWFYQYDALGRLLQESTPAVEQTRVQGIAWQADFAGLAQEAPGSQEFIDLLAQRGLELTASDYLSFNVQLPEDPGAIEGGIPVAEGSAFIASTASGSINQSDFNRTTGSSWQTDFSISGNQFSGDIGLTGYVYKSQTYLDRGLNLRIDGTDVSVSYIDSNGVEKVEIFSQPTEAGEPIPVQLEDGAVYRTVFTVTRSSVTHYVPEDVTVNTVSEDETGNVTTTTSVVTVQKPVTTTVANFNIQLLKQNGYGWDFVGTHVIEGDSDWITTSGQDASGQQDAFAQLKVQSNGTPSATGGMTLHQFARILPDARSGEWAEENQTITATERVQTRYEYDSLGNVTRLVEAFGTLEQRETGFVYDKLGRQTTTVHPEVGIYDESWDALAGDYHSNARLETTIRPREHTFYDEFGNETAHTDVRGNHSYKLYDEGNRLTYEVDAEGYVTGYSYDGFGNVETLTRYAESVLTFVNNEPVIAGQQPIIFNGRKALDYTQFDQYVEDYLASESPDFDNRKITTEYDALGRKTAVIQHLDNVVVGGDAAAGVEGQLLSSTLTSGFEYNAFGQAVREWQSDWTIQAGQITSQEVNTYHFHNELGQRIATVDPEKYLITFQYDGEGNLTGQTEYAHQLTVNTSSNAATISEASLAALPNTESGLATLLNTHQRITRPSEDEEITQDELSTIGYDRVIRYEYDALNRQTVVWQDYLIQDAVTVTEGVDENNIVDPFRSNLSVKRSYKAETASVAQSRMEYDALGNLVKMTDANGSITYTYYDALGRVTAVVEPERLSQIQDSPEMLAIRHLNKGQSTAALEWRTPQLAGIEKVELRVVAYDAASMPDNSASWITYSSKPNLSNGERPLSVNADGTTRVNLSDLDSDKYRYEVLYYRQGESDPYGLASGVIDIVTDQGTPSGTNIVSWVNVVKNGNNPQATLMLKGNLPQGLSGVEILVDGVAFTSVTQSSDGASLVMTSDRFNAYGVHSYQVIIDNNVVSSGSYRIETGDISKLGTTFGIGEASYSAIGKITSRQSYNWNSSKPNWKGSNKYNYTLKGFEHLGAENFEYKVRVTKYDAMGGDRQYTHTDGGNASGMTHSDWTKSSKKYRDVRLGSLDSLLLTARFNEVPGVTLLKGEGSEFAADYLEFYNLYQTAGSETEYPTSDKIVLRYRLYQPSHELTNIDPNDPKLRTAQWREIELTRIGKGYYVVGRGAIPDGQYEYQLVHVTLAGVENDITQNLTGQGTAHMNLGQVDAQIDIDAGGYSIVAPLTEFRYDALGNRVGETRYAEGAQIGSYTTEDYKARISVGTPETPEGNDQERLWRYDANGNMRQYVNAEGHSNYFSYDEAGNLRKEWSALSYETANGISTSRVQGAVYHYDRTGRQTEVITLRPFLANEDDNGQLSVQQMVYNGFGEAIQRRTLTETQWNASLVAAPGHEDPGYDETFNYDSAGRLIRSHQGGVDTVYFYDNRGRVTHEVRHSGIDWNHAQKDHTGAWNLLDADLDFTSLFNALNADSTLAVTRYNYDQNGRVVAALRPEWSQAGSTLAPLMRQRLDRWGNVIETTSESGSQILAKMEYRYNQRNQQIAAIQSPTQGQTMMQWKEVEDPTDPAAKVLEEQALPSLVNELYYDHLGRQVATKDANSNLRAMIYDAGGNEVRSVNGEGYHEYQSFDALGNLREKTNALGHSQFYVYDKENRLTHHFTAAGGETRYTYDSAGNRNIIQQRIAEGESTANWITTRQVFDTTGNLIQSNTGGLYRTYAYDQYGNKVYEARGGNGVTSSGAVAATWTYDAYGRMTAQTDFGGIDSVYDYDKAGRLRDKSTLEARYINVTDDNQNLGIHTVQYDYFANGLLQGQRVVDSAGNAITGQRLAESAYQYDALGRQVKETLTYGGSIGTVTTDNTYDGFGRLKTVVADSSGWGDYGMSLEYGYDAVGNRRYVKETSSLSQDVSENWYTYDGENRILKSQFAVQGFTNGDNDYLRLVAPTSTDVSAYEIQYDKYGNRDTMTRHTNGNAYLEAYNYDADNRHTLTYIGSGGRLTGNVVSKKEYDYAGRLEWQDSSRYSQDDYSNPQAALYRTYYVYNERNQQYKTVTLNSNNAIANANNVSIGSGSNSASSIVINNYNTDGTLRNYINKFNGGTYTYTYSYAWFDDAKTARIYGDGGSGTRPGSTDEYYDVLGNVIRIDDRHNNSNDRNLTVNTQGQIIRQQWGGQGEGDSKNDYYFYSNGHSVGDSRVIVNTTMRKVKLDGDYTRSGMLRGISSHFKYIKVPDVTRDVKADIDSNFTSIGSQYPAAQPSTYTVQSAGETLESIALSLWGDSSLWYLLADANGLSRSSTLSSGQALKVPNTVTNIRNAADTFKPYSVGEIIGNTLPEIPLAPPPAGDSGGGCGAAQIIVVVVAVVATIFTAGAAAVLAGAASSVSLAGGVAFIGTAFSSVGAFAAVAAAGFVGSLVGQAAGIGLGIRQGFDFTEAAVSGLSTAVGGGLGGDFLSIPGGGAWTETANFALQQTASYVANYGISKTAGYDVHFSWREVAANMIAAKAVSGVFGSSQNSTGSALGDIARDTLMSTAQGVLKREILRPYGHAGKMETTEIAANAFGQAIGNAIAASGTPLTAEEQFRMSLFKGGASNSQIDSFLANEQNQKTFGLMTRIAEVQRTTGKSFEDLPLELQNKVLNSGRGHVEVLLEDGTTSPRNLKRELISNSAYAIKGFGKTVSNMVELIGEDNASMAVLGMQAVIGGVPKAVLNLMWESTGGELIANAIDTHLKQPLSEFIAEEGFNRSFVAERGIGGEQYLEDIDTTSKFGGSLGVDLLLAGGAAVVATATKFFKRSDRSGVSNLSRLDEHPVEAFDPYENKNVKNMTPEQRKAYLKEYDKQLRAQQDALNDLSANEFKAARDAFRKEGRNPDAEAAQRRMGKQFEREVAESIRQDLVSKGMDAKMATTLAKERAKVIKSNLAALHEPDMVAGGHSKPQPIRMGNSNINSAIGPSWRSRLPAIDDMVKNAIQSGYGNAKLNVRLDILRGPGS